MNNMAWKAQCAEFFSQYKELLEDFTYSLEEFKETLNEEQCHLCHPGPYNPYIPVGADGLYGLYGF